MTPKYRSGKQNSIRKCLPGKCCCTNVLYKRLLLKWIGERWWVLFRITAAQSNIEQILVAQHEHSPHVKLKLVLIRLLHKRRD